jgi:hypothetical protein
MGVMILRCSAALRGPKIKNLLGSVERKSLLPAGSDNGGFSLTIASPSDGERCNQFQ